MKYRKIIIAFLLLFSVTGCTGADISETESQPPAAESAPAAAAPSVTAEETESPAVTVREVDYSSYFGGINGSAVFFNPRTGQYDIYNMEQASEQRSPCSTFKIISSLAGLQEGVIDPQSSVRAWGGKTFWNEKWNQDLDFPTAFQTSCVWYFREVIDDLGKDRIQACLDGLDYGNRDISDWEGRQNTSNSNRELTGFWIESSLKISPRQQTDVMAGIFEPGSKFSGEALQQLKSVMLAEQDTGSGNIYGKTGTGKQNNAWVDAWFVGFLEQSGGNIYFAVHLGQTEGVDLSGSMAREIAVQIAEDFYRE